MDSWKRSAHSNVEYLILFADHLKRPGCLNINASSLIDSNTRVDTPGFDLFCDDLQEVEKKWVRTW